jgi:fluoride ion exporter CrcB/FEX
MKMEQVSNPHVLFYIILNGIFLGFLAIPFGILAASNARYLKYPWALAINIFVSFACGILVAWVGFMLSGGFL